MKLKTRILLYLLSVFTIVLGVDLPLDTLVSHRMIPKEHAQIFESNLVQDNEGRIKPLHTVSSEILRKIARKETLYNQNAMQIILGMMVDPLLWQMVPIIKVSNDEVLSLLDKRESHVSFTAFFSENNYILTPYVESAYAKRPINRSKFDKKIIEIDERVNICSMLFSNNLIKMFPQKNDIDAPWLNDALMNIPGVDSLRELSFNIIYRDLVYTAFTTKNWGPANAMIKYIDDYQNQYAQSILPPTNRVRLEILYNKIKPFGWTRLFLFYSLLGLILLCLLLLKVFYINRTLDLLSNLTKLFIFSSFSMHFLSLALRWYISGHAPWSNAYESVIFIAFATMLAGIFFSRKSEFTLVASSLVASMLLFVANLNWLNPEITNLVPVLKSYWLMIHVSVITSSYGFFGLCAFLGFFNLILCIISHNSRIYNNVYNLTIINEQSMMIGLFLLTIGTFLGGVWANESWGRYWGWDPKETWALVSCVVYAVILHIRLLKSKKYIYWFNVSSLFGFGAILMTYFGVNYYLDGLHSYAAGDAFPIPSFVVPTIIILVVISLVGFFRFINLDINIKNE